MRILRECRGNVGKAAKMLGIHRSTLYRRLEKLGIQVNSSPVVASIAYAFVARQSRDCDKRREPFSINKHQ